MDLTDLESFAFAADRTEVLARLVAGSADYCHYHYLHHQHNEQFKAAAKLGITFHP